MKGKNLQPRTLYPARLSFRFDREIKSITDKQKLREFSTPNQLYNKAKGTSLSGKEKVTTRNKKNYKWESSPVKANIKVGNHPHTNMISKPVIIRGQEYKCRIFEMHLKLRDQQLKRKNV